jgi:hypothetical protein
MRVSRKHLRRVYPLPLAWRMKCWGRQHDVRMSISIQNVMTWRCDRCTGHFSKERGA